MLLTLEQLDQKIQKIPSLPRVVTKILNMIDQGDFNVGDLGKVISQDPGIAARTLHIANSPFYGVPGEVGSINEACVLLGVHTIRSIVLANGIINAFPIDNVGKFDRFEFWRHAAGTGVASRVLAKHHGYDEWLAFTAGLLHDIGKLVQDVYFHEVFEQVLQYREAEDCLLREAEISLLGFDHTLIGAKLARYWDLPRELELAVARHHCPDEEPASCIIDLVHLADILCRGLGIGDGGDPLIPPIAEGTMRRLGLAWEKLPFYLAEIEELNNLENIFLEQ